MTVAVRPARADDVDAVAEVELACFPDDAWTPAYLDELVAGGIPTSSLLVALDETGEVVGHAILSMVFDVAELQRIAVLPEARRHGVARTILAAVVDRAAGEGAQRLLLEVREHNAPALALYAGAGFVELDRRPRYYSDGSTAVVLELDLGAEAPGS